MAAGPVSYKLKMLQYKVRTYVAHVDDGRSLSTRCRKVGERVWGHSRNGLEVGTTSESTAESTAAAKAAAKTTAATEIATTTETTTATEAAKAATAAEAYRSTGVTVFTDLEHAALPFVAVELLDGIARIVRGFEGDNSGALGTARGIGVNVGTDHGTLLGCTSYRINNSSSGFKAG